MFDNEKIDFNNNNSSLSTEMIAEQNGDYIVEAINIRFSRIVTLYENLSLTNLKFFKHRDVKVAMEEIDSLLHKRFGIKFKHINASGFGYAVFTAPPKQYNVINRDIVDMHDETMSYLNVMGKRDSNVSDNVEDYHSNETDVLHGWMRSVEAIDKQFRKDGITLNLAKARIDNLPSKYMVYLCVDFDLLIGRGELTGSELTAVLLHEVGHAFTHIEYSYRTVNNTAVIVDSMKSVVDESMSYNKALTLSYGKLGGNVKDVKGKDNITATIMTVNKYINSTRSINSSNTHSTTDSEQLADQFSGKFGVGGELSVALTKLHSVGVELERDAVVQTLAIVGLQTLFGMLIAVGSVSGAIVMTAGLLAVIAGVSMVIVAGVEMYNGGGVRDGIVYDTDNRRQKRIRNEVVRQLRSAKLPKGVIKDHLNYLDTIDMQIALTDSDSSTTSTFAKIGRMVFSANSEAVNIKEMEELVEDLMENEIYVSANKLKTL